MPIEFSCTACGQLVRTPDSAAGKKGKCPHCGTIAQIPLAIPPAALPGLTPLASSTPKPKSPPRDGVGEGRNAAGGGAVISFRAARGQTCGRDDAAGKRKYPHCQAVVRSRRQPCPRSNRGGLSGLTPLAPLPAQPAALKPQPGPWARPPTDRKPSARRQTRNCRRSRQSTPRRVSRRWDRGWRVDSFGATSGRRVTPLRLIRWQRRVATIYSLACRQRGERALGPAACPVRSAAQAARTLILRVAGRRWILLRHQRRQRCRPQGPALGTQRRHGKFSRHRDAHPRRAAECVHADAADRRDHEFTGVLDLRR
jgi:hypothetical protein